MGVYFFLLLYTEYLDFSSRQVLPFRASCIVLFLPEKKYIVPHWVYLIRTLELPDLDLSIEMVAAFKRQERK